MMKDWNSPSNFFDKLSNKPELASLQCSVWVATLTGGNSAVADCGKSPGNGSPSSSDDDLVSPET